MAIDREKLLQIPEVVDEINRYKWIQSEMVGYDIGFDKAAGEWFEKYASAWVAYHMPKGSKEVKGKSSAKKMFLF